MSSVNLPIGLMPTGWLEGVRAQAQGLLDAKDEDGSPSALPNGLTRSQLEEFIIGSAAALGNQFSGQEPTPSNLVGAPDGSVKVEVGAEPQTGKDTGSDNRTPPAKS